MNRRHYYKADFQVAKAVFGTKNRRKKYRSKHLKFKFRIVKIKNFKNYIFFIKSNSKKNESTINQSFKDSSRKNQKNQTKRRFNKYVC